MADFHPASADEMADIVARAAGLREPLEVAGNATKHGIGRPITTPHRLFTANLRGVTLYEPEELVLSARAGTPLSDIETLLARHNQHLAFEPPHWGEQTIGGVIAAGLSGPRRIQAGAVRDHVLGFAAVNGRGEIFKSGGRVVKNVTGYDLSKLMTGSFGTLAVLTEVTLKVLPRPECRVTLVAHGQPATEGVALLSKALASPLDVSAAVWVSEHEGTSVTALRLEGFSDSVAERAAALKRLLGVCEAGPSFDSFWENVRDISLLDQADALWRVSVPPSEGSAILRALPGTKAILDWGGGRVWLAIPDDGQCGEKKVRAAVAKTGGHATLFRASAQTRAKIAVFQPQPPALAALTLRVKESFDPLHLFNPGRMYEGV